MFGAKKMLCVTSVDGPFLNLYYVVERKNINSADASKTQLCKTLFSSVLGSIVGQVVHITKFKLYPFHQIWHGESMCR